MRRQTTSIPSMWTSGTGRKSSPKEDRNMDTLKQVVQEVYQALKKTEKYMAIEYDYIEEILPKNIFFITSQELEDMYPDCPRRSGNTRSQSSRALSLSCRSATS